MDLLERVQPMATKTWRDWSISRMRKGWESWDSLVFRKEAAEGISYINNRREVKKKIESDSSQWCPVAGHKSMSKTGTQESPSEHQKTVFHCEGAQQGDGVSILGHIKTLSGQSWATGSRWPFEQGGWTRGLPASSCFLHLQPLCDSVICIWVRSLFCRETPSDPHLMTAHIAKLFRSKETSFRLKLKCPAIGGIHSAQRIRLQPIQSKTTNITHCEYSLLN